MNAPTPLPKRTPEENDRIIRELMLQFPAAHDPTFKSIGDELSGHESAMIVAGIKAAVNKNHREANLSSQTRRHLQTGPNT